MIVMNVKSQIPTRSQETQGAHCIIESLSQKINNRPIATPHLTPVIARWSDVEPSVHGSLNSQLSSQPLPMSTRLKKPRSKKCRTNLRISGVHSVQEDEWVW
ncbi:unnamed protein product [Cuscuta europaea]|uniref:Uncharacterized protein n=1 Tax=Cuscuta europaea TaxID=41803 RepID=A0A9P0YS80_CUSEU|nr:unnamed protein product [Cuscuta europaea]